MKYSLLGFIHVVFDLYYALSISVLGHLFILLAKRVKTEGCSVQTVSALQLNIVLLSFYVIVLLV